MLDVIIVDRLMSVEMVHHLHVLSSLGRLGLVSNRWWLALRLVLFLRITWCFWGSIDVGEWLGRWVWRTEHSVICDEEVVEIVLSWIICFVSRLGKYFILNVFRTVFGWRIFLLWFFWVLFLFTFIIFLTNLLIFRRACATLIIKEIERKERILELFWFTLILYIYSINLIVFVTIWKLIFLLCCFNILLGDILIQDASWVLLHMTSYKVFLRGTWTWALKLAESTLFVIFISHFEYRIIFSFAFNLLF